MKPIEGFYLEYQVEFDSKSWETVKFVFILKIFKILSWLFGYVEKRLGRNAKVNFKFYGVTAMDNK